MIAIQVDNFKKSFNGFEAVRGVSLSVNQSELFGLIGPDGAGKTTLLRAICTLLVPDEGIILVDGKDVTREVESVRALLGYMPQRFSLYQDMTVEQNLQFFADLFQVPPKAREERLEQLYRFSRLGPFKNRATGALSGGMKQKLALSCALIHTPGILVLDEPTTGIDPVSRQEFWEILRSIQREGTTILMSTPYMDEANQCDRVALFYRGRIVAMGTPRELKQKFPYPLYRIQGHDLRRLKEFFQRMHDIQNIQLFGDVLHVSFLRAPQDETWQAWEKHTGNNLQAWAPHSPTIEDVFLDLMGESE